MRNDRIELVTVPEVTVQVPHGRPASERTGLLAAGVPADGAAASSPRWKLTTSALAVSLVGFVGILSMGSHGSSTAPAAPAAPVQGAGPTTIGQVPFESRTRQHFFPSAAWENIGPPYPSGIWWSNLAMDEGDQIVVALPYQYRTTPFNESTDYEGFGGGLQLGDGALRRTVTDKAVIDWFGADVCVRAAEGPVNRPTVDRYDPLTVDLRFDLVTSTPSAEGEPAVGFRAILARGAPFTTFVFHSTTPLLVGMPGVTLLALDFVAKSPAMTAYTIDYSNGERWLVVLEGFVELITTAEGHVIATTPLDGVLRLALVPEGAPDALQYLMAHSLTYPISADVTWAFSQAHPEDEASTTEVATYAFTFEAVRFRQAPTDDAGPLLMLALPHHIDTLRPDTPPPGSAWWRQPDESALASLGNASALAYRTLKGLAKPVLGTAWHMDEVLTDIDFHAKSSLDDSPLEWREQLAKALATDMTGVASGTNPDGLLVDPKWRDPYGFGKAVARVARLGLIAEDLGEQEHMATALDQVQAALLPWVTSSNSDTLVFDEVWGGLISSDGVDDDMADFGNGRYNDHHFHYGYLIYAAAVLCREERGFCSQHDDALRSIISDIANPGPVYNLGGSPLHPSQDEGTPSMDASAWYTRFPHARHKDWFDGHSWASGLFPMPNGKSQESVSEAVNAYYAVHLYGKAVGDDDLSRWGRLLLALELRAAHLYWQMPDESDVYPQLFKTSKMVGVVGSADAKVWTWFGENPEYVHGINMMPFTPITEELLPSHFVAQEWPVMEPRLNKCQDQWRGILELAHAILDPQSAFDAVLPLQDNLIDGFDAGNSLTNSLYWVATRPQAATSAP